MYKSDLLELNEKINHKSHRLSKEVLREIMKIRRQIISKIGEGLDFEEGVFSAIESQDWYQKLSQTKKDYVAGLVLVKLKKDNALLISRVRKTQLDNALEDKRMKKMPHISEHKAREKIDTKPRKRFYTFQSVFSDFNDFLELENDRYLSEEKENEILGKIVIDPSKISDNLVLQLSSNKEEFKRLLDIEKVEKRKVKKEEIRFLINNLKADFISELKEILSNTKPILYGVKAKSGRVNVVNNRGLRSYGKILLISSPSFYDEERERVPEYKQTILVFDNIYDFLRSQYYALYNISEEKDLVKRYGRRVEDILISNQDSFFDIFVDEVYESMFGDKTNYHIARAGNRVKKLNKTKGKKPQIDLSRIAGVSGDFSRRRKELSGQENAIKLQLQELQNAFKTQIARIKSIHDFFYKDFLQSFSADELEKLIDSKDESKLVDFFGTNRKILTELKNHITKNTNFYRQFVASPFNYFWDEIDSFERELREILRIGKPNKQEILEFFRRIYFVNLNFKRQISLIFLNGIKHILKLDKLRKAGIYSSDFIEKQCNINILLASLDDVKSHINSRKFLEGIPSGDNVTKIKSKQELYFEEINKKLDIIREFLLLGDIDALGKYLRN